MTKINRRTVLAGMAAPMVLTGRAFGRPAAGERVTMGIIGCGDMGTANLNGFLDLPDVQVVAVCDVDAKYPSGRQNVMWGREPAQARVEQKYAEQTKSGEYKGCAVYKDFRELCARKDIDAVVVATPDHWHALCGLEALKSGKDVYGEKPITHLFAEGKLLAETVKKRERIFQTGSQQRSEGNFHRGAELVRNGVIGRLKHVEVGLPEGHKNAPGDAKEAPVPDHLDYDFWCGPSEKLPFIWWRTKWNWRWHLSYGGGQMMDWIGHNNDIAHWGMDMDESGPVEVQACGFAYPKDRSVINAAYDYMIFSRYPNGVTVTMSNKHTRGCKWIGEDGWIFVQRGKIEASKPEILKTELKPDAVQIYKSPGHRRNFIDGVKTRKPCIAAAEIAHRSATPGHLGLISEALGGRKIKWDPEKQQPIGDPEVEKLLQVHYRAPWKLEG